jgi:hypothetical protein
VTATKFITGKRDDGGSARRFTTPTPGRGTTLLPHHPAVRGAGTKYPSTIVHPAASPRILVGGHNAAKIGKDIRKGRWAGMPVFTLTLEERATCPRACRQWLNCYGNNMHLARRLAHGPALEERLWNELALRDQMHPGGFVVRLHILGDFYSLAYVRLWERALAEFPALRVFGYTAHDPDGPDEIGGRLWCLATEHWDRFALRFSGAAGSRQTTIVVASPAEVPAGTILCPAQVGKTERCGTCALCWQSTRQVAFLRH